MGRAQAAVPAAQRARPLAGAAVPSGDPLEPAIRAWAKAYRTTAATSSGCDPPHAAVVGAKDDAGAGALFRAALAQPLSYRRIEWLDAAESRWGWRGR